MSLLTRLTRGSDDLDTPASAVAFIEPWLPHTIWECAPGRGRLVDWLRGAGHIVIPGEGDFFTAEPPADFDAIVTNPPFSKKRQFIARCAELQRPWALLLPVTTLGVRGCQVNLVDCEIIFLPRRVDFTGKKGPWFAVAWFTWGLGVGRQITFMEDD